MFKPRKTFSVASLLFMVNTNNLSRHQSSDARKGANALLDRVLHATGNYEGFSYLTANKVPEGERPGINELDLAEGDDQKRFENTDQTRVSYNVSREIHKEYCDLCDVAAAKEAQYQDSITAQRLGLAP